MNIYGDFAHKSPKLKTTQTSSSVVNGLKNQENKTKPVVHLHNGILLHNKKELTTDTGENTKDSMRMNRSK